MAALYNHHDMTRLARLVIVFLLFSRTSSFLTRNTWSTSPWGTATPSYVVTKETTTALRVSTTTTTTNESWKTLMGEALNPYRSTQLYPTDKEWQNFLKKYEASKGTSAEIVDPFWEQTKEEARLAVSLEPEAGPQIYQGILSQRSLLEAICTVVSHCIETELIPATYIKNLFLEILTPADEVKIRMDLQAVVERCTSVSTAMEAVLFHNGFHTLVGYRLGHRLWQLGRVGLAYYMQSTVSRTFSADLHPACRLGKGTYLRVGAGVIIGETARVGDDCSIFEGVTLGGTGKEAGDRHPKVGTGVIVRDGAAVLGNIPVGDGSIVCSKSIVTKPVPPLAIVSGVPAKITGYRTLTEEAFDEDLQHHLVRKYLHEWQKIQPTESKK